MCMDGLSGNESFRQRENMQEWRGGDGVRGMGDREDE